MRLLILSLVSVLTVLRLTAQSCPCEDLFNHTRELVEQNYAGWFDKVTPANRSLYDKWNEAQQQKIKLVKTDSACIVQLSQWVSFFKDKNLRISQLPVRRNADGSIYRREDPVIPRFNISEQQVRYYLGSSRSLDSVEGIFRNEQYTLGVVRSEKQRYLATVISTTEKNWKPEDVKFILEKKEGHYNAALFNDDKTDSTHPTVVIAGNILDLGTAFFERIFPEPEQRQNLFEYEMSRDPLSPALEFREGGLAIWRFPGFGKKALSQTAYLLQKNAAQLEKSSNWIIDLRGNNAADYEAAMQLMKYIYTDPVVKPGAEMRVTAQNIDAWIAATAKSIHTQANESVVKTFDSLCTVMRTKEGGFFNRNKYTNDTIRIAKPATHVKRVALLINKQTAGAAELFTLLCRQSKKVKVFGQVSAGAADYGNVVVYDTGCSTVRLSLPIDRMLWPDEGFSVDKAGIHPDRLFVTDDWIAAVLNEWKIK